MYKSTSNIKLDIFLNYKIPNVIIIMIKIYNLDSNGAYIIIIECGSVFIVLIKI